jgi:hypothetical protein
LCVQEGGDPVECLENRISWDVEDPNYLAVRYKSGTNLRVLTTRRCATLFANSLPTVRPCLRTLCPLCDAVCECEASLLANTPPVVQVAGGGGGGPILRVGVLPGNI